MEKFGNSFLTQGGNIEIENQIKECKLVGLLFGASYCEPYINFVSKLETAYEEINREEKVFEIIYLNFEQKQIDFINNFKQKWLAYDFKDKKKNQIYFEYKDKITGIPALLIIDPQTLKIVSKNGRGLFELKQPAEAFEQLLEEKALVK